MTDYPIVAIMYDFDRTLCTKDMQDYSFIPSLGMTEEEFWRYSNQLAAHKITPFRQKHTTFSPKTQQRGIGNV